MGNNPASDQQFGGFLNSPIQLHNGTGMKLENFAEQHFPFAEAQCCFEDDVEQEIKV
jgi:hypothetical protein